MYADFISSSMLIGINLSSIDKYYVVLSVFGIANLLIRKVQDDWYYDVFKQIY